MPSTPCRAAIRPLHRLSRLSGCGGRAATHRTRRHRLLFRQCRRRAQPNDHPPNEAARPGGMLRIDIDVQLADVRKLAPANDSAVVDGYLSWAAGGGFHADALGRQMDGGCATVAVLVGRGIAAVAGNDDDGFRENAASVYWHVARIECGQSGGEGLSFVQLRL